MTEKPLTTYAGAGHDAVWRQLVFPEDYQNPVPKDRYHLVVVGAGPAGLVAAIAAAGLGARVALVEKKAMGGDCLNVGCVPSKALLECTRNGAGETNFDAAFAWMREVRSRIAHHDSVERYAQAGVDVFLGAAQLLDGQTVGVGERRLAARRVVLATGARAALPPIPGLTECEPLTNETLFDLTEKPRSLAILGAGPIGCEMAQAMSRLGVAVHLFEMADRVLPSEVPEAGTLVGSSLVQSGVTLHLAARVSKLVRERGETTIHAGNDGATVERILVAAGRRANVEDLNLDAVGVSVRDGLIEVDSRLRTTNRRIFAAGDVCSRLQFTHNADAHARIVVQNALFAPTATTTGLVIPHCTFTDPEVAQVGRSKSALERDGTPFSVLRVDLGDLDRVQTGRDKTGFAEVMVARGSDEILGATVVAHDAGEQIAGLCIAMSNGLGLARLGKTVLAYPTRSEFLRRLADSYNRTRLTPTAKAAMKTWFRWTS